MDKIAQGVFGTNQFSPRPWAIMQHLLVYNKTNKHYADLNIESIERKSITSMCEKLKLHMETSAKHVTGKEAVRFEREIGSDVANNQHVKTINKASVAAREIDLENEENGESVVQYSYVTNNEHAYLAEDCVVILGSKPWLRCLIKWMKTMKTHQKQLRRQARCLTNLHLM